MTSVLELENSGKIGLFSIHTHQKEFEKYVKVKYIKKSDTK